MYLNSAEIESDTRLKANVCIIGGGAAGISLAREMGAKGHRVILLEAGQEDYSDESQDQYKVESHPKLYPDPNWSRLRFWGGTTNHWAGNCSRLSSYDFEPRKFVPNSGWPISLKDLEPYYSKAEVYCQVPDTSDVSEGPIRSSGVTNVDLNKADLLPRTARMSPPTQFGLVWGPDLQPLENVSVIFDATVTDLSFNATSGAVEGVSVQSEKGKKFSVGADFFVLCTGGIENARILLQWNEQHENRLGNQGECVGRYFMDHPVVEGAFFLPSLPKENFGYYLQHPIDGYLSVGFWELSKESLEENKLANIRMPFIPINKYFASDGISSYHTLSKGNYGGRFWHHLGNVLADLDMVTEAIARKKFNRRLFGSANDFAGYLFDIMIEQYPERRNRVSLGEELDSFGRKRAKIEWKISDAEKTNLWRALDVVAKDVGKTNLGRVRLLKDRGSRIWGDQMSFGHHHMGTTRMANSAETGVVDRNQKVFGTQNFFVSGSSVFATGGHVPPTMSIVALTIRLSDHLNKRLRS